MGIETAVAAALITGATGLVGSELTNSANSENVAAANATSIELANTAHQREVADLKAAGLNPILSAGGSGSSSPSMQIPVLNNSIADASKEAITNFSALQSSRQYDPIIDKAKADANLSKALTIKAAAEASSAQAQAKSIEAQTGLTTEKASQEKFGWVGRHFGSKASDRFDALLDDLVKGVFANSAKKVSKSPKPKSSDIVEVPTGGAGW